jgi:hypothetical protein
MFNAFCQINAEISIPFLFRRISISPLLPGSHWIAGVGCSPCSQFLAFEGCKPQGESQGPSAGCTDTASISTCSRAKLQAPVTNASARISQLLLATHENPAAKAIQARAWAPLQTMPEFIWDSSVFHPNSGSAILSYSTSTVLQVAHWLKLPTIV